MKYSFGISNFLEEISSLSHSTCFLYFLALISEEGFLISPFYSLEICIQMNIYFLFSFAFHFSSFHSCLYSLLQQPIYFFAFLFLGDGLIPAFCTILWTSVHRSSGTLSDLTPWIYLSLPLYSCKRFDLFIAEWSSGFPYFLQFKSVALRSSWSEPRSAPGLVFADCLELLQLWLQTIWFWYWSSGDVHV